MHRNNFFTRRNCWTRILVVALLVSLHLAPIHAQDITPLRAAFPCRFCPRPSSQIEPQAGRWKTWALSSARSSGSHRHQPGCRKRSKSRI